MKIKKMLFIIVIIMLVGCNNKIHNTSVNDDGVKEQKANTTLNIETDKKVEEKKQPANDKLQENIEEQLSIDKVEEPEEKQQLVNDNIKEYQTQQQPVDNKIEKSIEKQLPNQENDGIIYINNSMGFSITFPNSWEGYYNIIEDENGGCIDIRYKGKDGTIKGQNGKGLYMFSIIREDKLNNFLDSINVIGTFREKNYYYATHTDFEIGSLRDEEEESNNADFKKAMSMLEDVPQILKTIKAIEQQPTEENIEKESQHQEEGIKYVNDVMGFSLMLPNSWEGNYNVVEEENGGCITIRYKGKDSIIMGDDEKGLYMFSIIREDKLNNFLDSVKKIGIYREQNYYYATHTDFEIGLLRDEDDESNNTDFKKAMSMLEDVPQILETIKAIE